MRYLFTILILTGTLTGLAQVKPGALAGKLPGFYAGFKQLPALQKDMPAIYIDSIKVDKYVYFKYISIKDIDSIKTVNKSLTLPYGALYIKMKDHKKAIAFFHAKLLSLKEVAKSHLSPAKLKLPMLYVLDDEIITDTTGIAIPSSQVYDVTSFTGNEAPYLKKIIPNVLFVLIATKPREEYIR